ncbi:winged helix-turn-helix domain-containing protein [Thioflexithrix psekupsensis]|uniref:winged helix-turn-helix domain-containing protein n=1 Tax=Thioflexithrix psekupsensis TaxID=1570016 RepID=UPI001C3E1D58|nr:winged helix-turn-helix domain-containing protein [Thioflexithrix psekupsensis]
MVQYLNQHKDIQLLLLDLMLPEEDGFALIRWLRSQDRYAHLPILVLSSLGEDVDRIVGLEMGADDYMAKPANLRELLARVRALLRRIHAANEPKKEQTHRYRFGEFDLDVINRRLLRHEKVIPLTSTEFYLLSILVTHPSCVLSRDDLMNHLKGYDCDPYDRTIDIHISRLRSKIEPDPKNPSYIRTVRGKGYLFSPEETMD